MLELKNSHESAIIKSLEQHSVLGVIKLLELTRKGDTPEDYVMFHQALRTLERKGLIEVVSDKTSTLQVVRLKHVLH